MKIQIENNKVEYKFTRKSQDLQYITPLHWQREIEIIHIIKGEYLVDLNDISITANDGDILVFGSGYTHSLKPLKEDCLIDVVLFSAKFLHKFFPKCEKVRFHIAKNTQQELEIFDNLSNIFDNISLELCTNKTNSEIIVQAEMIKLWAIITRYFKENTEKQNGRNIAFERFQKVFEYIDENYMYDLELDNLAELLNYTPGYISKLFAEYSGLTFKKYLNTIRVKKACELMESTDLKLSSIAGMCGFGSIRTFNENFLKIMQCSPREYLKKI